MEVRTTDYEFQDVCEMFSNFDTLCLAFPLLSSSVCSLRRRGFQFVDSLLLLSLLCLLSLFLIQSFLCFRFSSINVLLISEHTDITYIISIAT